MEQLQEILELQFPVGEIIAFLDSDVILDKNYYKTLINYFERFDDLIAIQGVDHSLIESQMQIKKLNKFNKFLYKTEQFFETSLILIRIDLLYLHH